MKKYGIGDKIKYGTYGECVIIARRNENIGGKLREFFVLSQNKTQSTILVPVEKAESFREVKPALTVEQITALKFVKPYKINWETDDKTRDAEFKNMFERDDASEITAVWLAIIARQDELKAARKKLRATDLNAMRICEKILYDEFSRTLNLQPDDVSLILTGIMEP